MTCYLFERRSKPRVADADTVAYLRELELAMDGSTDDPEQQILLVANMHREVSARDAAIPHGWHGW